MENVHGNEEQNLTELLTHSWNEGNERNQNGFFLQIVK